MSCTELNKLREEIRALNGQLKDLRKKSATANDRRESARHKHDTTSVELLKRRAERASVAIEQHIATHHCTHS